MITKLKNYSYKAGAVATVAVGGFVYNASNVFAQADPDNECTDITSGGLNQGVECAQPSGAARDLFGSEGSIFQSVANALLFLVGAISVIMLIIGGIRYVVSAGDQNAVTGAKNTILYAIVGIIVSFLAFAAVRFVTTQLGTSTDAS